MQIRYLFDIRTMTEEKHRFWLWVLLLGLATCGLGGSLHLLENLAEGYWAKLIWLESRGPLAFLFLLGAASTGVALSKSPSAIIRRRAEVMGVLMSMLFTVAWLAGFVHFYEKNLFPVVPVDRLGMLAVLSALIFLFPQVFSQQDVTPSMPEVELASIEKSPLSTSDNTLYFALGGAIAVGLSLLALPWFRVNVGRWDGSITFNDLRELYGFARDKGFNSDVRFYYLEWGYLVSYLSALLAIFMALKVRDLGRPIVGVLPKFAIGATVLMGVWQAVLASGLTSLDEEGSVQIGAWLGVAGHVALTSAFVLCSKPSSLKVLSPET
jgi:hypothetical protein